MKKILAFFVLLTLIGCDNVVDQYNDQIDKYNEIISTVQDNKAYAEDSNLQDKLENNNAEMKRLENELSSDKQISKEDVEKMTEFVTETEEEFKEYL